MDPSPAGFVASPVLGTPPLLPPLAAFPPVVPPFSVPPPGFGAFPPPLTLTGSEPVAGDAPDRWTEHKAPDGRVYYYNAATKQSSWQKPDQLKTPAELLLSQCPWKEYTTDNGKIYYHNVNTKESRWVIPAELEDIKKRISSEGTNLTHSLPEAGHPKTPGSAASSSALEASMAATLAAISVPSTPPPPERSSDDLATATTSPLPSAATLDPPKVNAASPTVAVVTIPNNVPAAPAATTTTGVSMNAGTAAINFKDKKEAVEMFKDLLRECAVPSNATWEQCVRLIQGDARYELFKRFNEKKQAFNAYKTQKQKDEKDESRLRAKRSKEQLEQFLLTSDRLTSHTKYYRCDELFTSLPVWQAVPDADRRDIYDDVVFALAKREKDEAKVLKRRNMKRLADVLDNMTKIRHNTTWAEAQMMLLENGAFKNDVNLLAMDKEDALVVFEQHIRELEREEVEERERERRRLKRQQRKNRDQFLALLDALHEEGKLTSMSLWVELYPLLSADLRFSAMLGQNGSTPLDLFKFYVEDLKARFHDEKRIIREILRDKHFDVKADTTFEQFATVVCEDRKSATLDAGNVKLTYNSLLEKAEAKERERVRDESRRMRRLEHAFKQALRELLADGVEDDDSLADEQQRPWAEVRTRLELLPECQALTSEQDRERVYAEYQREVEESCSHHHSRSARKASKKAARAAAAKAGKKRSYSSELEDAGVAGADSAAASNNSASDNNHSPLEMGPTSADLYPVKKKKSKKSKHRRRSSRSLTPQRQPPSSPLSPAPMPHRRSDERKNNDGGGTPTPLSRHKSKPHADDDEDDDDFTNVLKRRKNMRSVTPDSNPERGDLSETELEKQRALLLAQLKEPEFDD